MKKLLLHICCAPCAVYVIEKLREEYDVTGFFYNPNIHPVEEYLFRVRELEAVALRLGWNTVIPEYDDHEWFRMTEGLGDEPERGKRCRVCFDLRFERTFEHAKNNVFDIVASTLSISPYKNTAQINESGKTAAEKYGIEFLPENFKKRNGFMIGKKMSVEHGIKHQDYCGCIYSKRDRDEKTRKRDLSLG